MYIKTSFSDYKPWSGAKDTVDYILNHDKTMDDIEQAMDQIFDGEDCVDVTSINDTLWFEPDLVCETLGIPSPDDEEENEDNADKD